MCLLRTAPWHREAFWVLPKISTSSHEAFQKSLVLGIILRIIIHIFIGRKRYMKTLMIWRKTHCYTRSNVSKIWTGYCGWILLIIRWAPGWSLLKKLDNGKFQQACFKSRSPNIVELKYTVFGREAPAKILAPKMLQACPLSTHQFEMICDHRARQYTFKWKSTQNRQDARSSFKLCLHCPTFQELRAILQNFISKFSYWELVSYSADKRELHFLLFCKRIVVDCSWVERFLFLQTALFQM